MNVFMYVRPPDLLLDPADAPRALLGRSLDHTRQVFADGGLQGLHCNSERFVIGVGVVGAVRVTTVAGAKASAALAAPRFGIAGSGGCRP